jgi:hypothetical protein
MYRLTGRNLPLDGLFDDTYVSTGNPRAIGGVLCLRAIFVGMNQGL